MKMIKQRLREASNGEQENCLSRLAGFGYRFAPSGDQDMTALRF